MSAAVKTPRQLAATVVVAASDSVEPWRASWDDTLGRYLQCDGTNDHIEIQAAIDALPATGGEVFLLDGTYKVEVSLVLDSYQTLRGCGRNTILTTTTEELVIVTATGGSGTEKVGITIADLCVDGTAGGSESGVGISWEYVDYSSIYNVWSLNNGGEGIKLTNCDHNRIEDNTSQGNGGTGIALNSSTKNIVSGNTVQGNTSYGIYVNGSSDNTITGNTSQENSNGIYLLSADNNTVTGNTCQGNNDEGIHIKDSNSNTVSSNTLTENSQTTTNTDDDIFLEGTSSYNNIQANTCRAGGEANVPRYGINISVDTCIGNLVENNDLYDDGFGTAPFNDAGTLTIVGDDNKGIEITQIKHLRYVKNTSGGPLVVGDVVSLKAVAAGNEVTTPAAIGEDQVYGMLAENIADAASGYVQVKGGTVLLKATNVGGGNIAVGDFLCTEAGVRARKAAGGHQVFARALETCDAAECVIDAYIKSPWD